MAFATYLGFLAFLYGYILPRNSGVASDPTLYTAMTFIILVIVFGFCFRAFLFGERLQRIETTDFRLDWGDNVLTRYWRGPFCISNCTQFLLAVAAVVASLVFSVLWIYRLL